MKKLIYLLVAVMAFVNSCKAQSWEGDYVKTDVLNVKDSIVTGVYAGVLVDEAKVQAMLDDAFGNIPSDTGNTGISSYSEILYNHLGVIDGFGHVDDWMVALYKDLQGQAGGDARLNNNSNNYTPAYAFTTYDSLGFQPINDHTVGLFWKGQCIMWWGKDSVYTNKPIYGNHGITGGGGSGGTFSSGCLDDQSVAFIKAFENNSLTTFDTIRISKSGDAEHYSFTANVAVGNVNSGNGIVLIGAPGAGKYISIGRVWFISEAGTAYSNPGGNNVLYLGTSQLAAYTDAELGLNSSNIGYSSFLPASSFTQTGYDITNKALVFDFNTHTGGTSKTIVIKGDYTIKTK